MRAAADGPRLDDRPGDALEEARTVGGREARPEAVRPRTVYA
ncbi:MAG: hypothetical protein ACC662_05065 [Planctomycetota bacterium]